MKASMKDPRNTFTISKAKDAILRVQRWIVASDGCHLKEVPVGFDGQGFQSDGLPRPQPRDLLPSAGDDRPTCYGSLGVELAPCLVSHVDQELDDYQQPLLRGTVRVTMLDLVVVSEPFHRLVLEVVPGVEQDHGEVTLSSPQTCSTRVPSPMCSGGARRWGARRVAEGLGFGAATRLVLQQELHDMTISSPCGGRTCTCPRTCGRCKAGGTRSPGT